MSTTARLLEMLLAGDSREEFDALLRDAQARGAPPERMRQLRVEHALAMRIHDHMAHLRSREAELSALNQTAKDLNEIRDVDQILTAIVARARQLLNADMTYLALNDEEQGASYMRVTNGALTLGFQRLRLPLGTGLLGRVAKDGRPYFTEDYSSDSQFVHRGYIDEAVEAEQIRAILGVPLTVDGKVIGALLAVHRRVRRFPPSEVALLSALAAHAAVALQNARLFDQERAAIEALDTVNAALRAQGEATEHAALAHDALTRVLSEGGDVGDVAGVLSEVLGGTLSIYGDDDQVISGRPDAFSAVEVADAIRAGQGTGRCVRVGEGLWVARAAVADDHCGTLLLRRDDPLEPSEERTLERGALVTALVIMFGRVEAEAERKVRGELLTDLLVGRDLEAATLRERAAGRGSTWTATCRSRWAAPPVSCVPNAGSRASRRHSRRRPAAWARFIDQPSWCWLRWARWNWANGWPAGWRARRSASPSARAGRWGSTKHGAVPRRCTPP